MTRAGAVERALAARQLTVWRDRAKIRLGVLLRDQLQDAIGDAGVVVLLWSKPAARSRWVTAEVLTAFHLNRFIVPCVLDATPLPHFLSQTVYLDLGRASRVALDALGRAVAAAPAGTNQVPPPFSSRGPELQATLNRIADLQERELTFMLRREIAEARRAHQKTHAVVGPAEKRWKFDALMLNLAGYHRKNAYMLKHWDAIQAGRGPKDPLLSRAERLFFETLLLDPTDPPGLDGLGSILMLEREYDAAEFFFIRAIEEQRKRGGEYSAAIANLEGVRRAKAGRQGGPTT